RNDLMERVAAAPALAVHKNELLLFFTLLELTVITAGRLGRGTGAAHRAIGRRRRNPDGTFTGPVTARMDCPTIV
ncbi:MAG TPA: hypothetical protein VII35_17470, partial [Steroidobacteraceae bacterium]